MCMFCLNPFLLDEHTDVTGCLGMEIFPHLKSDFCVSSVNEQTHFTWATASTLIACLTSGETGTCSNMLERCLDP